MTPEREKEIRYLAKILKESLYDELLEEIDSLRSEVEAIKATNKEAVKRYAEMILERDSLLEKLKIQEFRLNHIRENTECIGALKRHVDGNCIHCLAVPATRKVHTK